MLERQDIQEVVAVRLDRATYVAYESAANVLGVPVAAVLDAVVAAGEAAFTRLAGGAAGSSPPTSLPREGLGLYLALTCGGMIMGDATQCSLPGARASDYSYAADSADRGGRA